MSDTLNSESRSDEEPADTVTDPGVEGGIDAPNEDVDEDPEDVESTEATRGHRS